MPVISRGKQAVLAVLLTVYTGWPIADVSRLLLKQSLQLNQRRSEFQGLLSKLVSYDRHIEMLRQRANSMPKDVPRGVPEGMPQGVTSEMAKGHSASLKAFINRFYGSRQSIMENVDSIAKAYSSSLGLTKALSAVGRWDFRLAKARTFEALAPYESNKALLESSETQAKDNEALLGKCADLLEQSEKAVGALEGELQGMIDLSMILRCFTDNYLAVSNANRRRKTQPVCCIIQ